MTRVHAGRARRRASSFALALMLAGGTACGGGEGEAPAAETEGGESKPQPPRFVELESPQVLLSASETEELVFAVEDLQPQTQVELDGEASTPSGSAPAWLDLEAGELHVPLGGALITGRHELALRHELGGELLRSQILQLDIEESTPGPLAVTLGEPVGAGEALIVHGQGPEVVLALLDGAAQRATIRAGAWAKPGFELELPGLALAPGPEAWGLVDVSIATPGARWVVAVWIDGARSRAYARIVEVDGPGDPLGEPGPVLTLWDLDDPELSASFGPHELSAMLGVAALERSAVLSVEARRDAESSSPGDRLLQVRQLVGEGVPGVSALLRAPGGGDLDLVGDGRSWTGGFGQARLDLRADLGFARRLRVSESGLAQLVEERDPSAAVVPAGSVWLRSCDAAFGARQVFALELEADAAQLRVSRYERWRDLPEDPMGETGETGDAGDAGETGEEQPPAPPSGVSDELFELPALPSGPPVLTALDGIPTLLVPLGADTPALALRSSGAQTLMQSVEALRCDALAVASPGDDGVGDTLPLACLAGGSLRIGALGDN